MDTAPSPEPSLSSWAILGGVKPEAPGAAVPEVDDDVPHAAASRAAATTAVPRINDLVCMTSPSGMECDGVFRADADLDPFTTALQCGPGPRAGLARGDPRAGLEVDQVPGGGAQIDHLGDRPGRSGAA